MNNIFKHARSFLRSLRNGHYEVGPNGILFPRDHLLMHGEMGLRNITAGEDWVDNHNLVTVQGVNHFFETTLRGGSAFGTWYFAPYAANVTPVNTLTAANFAGTMTEFTNYTEGTRQACTFGAASGGVTSNSAAVATITIGAGGQTTLYGMGIASASAKSSTAGVMLSVSALAVGRTGIAQGDEYGMRYTLTGTST